VTDSEIVNPLQTSRSLLFCKLGSNYGNGANPKNGVIPSVAAFQAERGISPHVPHQHKTFQDNTGSRATTRLTSSAVEAALAATARVAAELPSDLFALLD
jgi:hypothetical protein